MRFNDVEKLFIEKYPNGCIYKESTYKKVNVFNVSYSGGKVYTYRVCNLTELCYKLKLKDRPLYQEGIKTLAELKENDEFGLFENL